MFFTPYSYAHSPSEFSIKHIFNKEVGLDKVCFCVLASGLDHWPVPKGNLYQLEATAYALLALVKVGVSTDGWVDGGMRDG